MTNKIDFMNVLDLARVVIYRFHEKGLEIFLINNEMDKDQEIWKLPQGITPSGIRSHFGDNVINFETLDENSGNLIKTMAIEGDWHDIPSIRGMLKHDIKLVKSIIKENLPGSEKGAFFAVKEAFKKVMPDEYKALKELKDILTDRNSIINI